LLDERIVDGDPKLVAIIEEAIELAHDALGHIDDSNGLVMPAIMQLRVVHERACKSLDTAPALLAERLFRSRRPAIGTRFTACFRLMSPHLGPPASTVSGPRRDRVGSACRTRARAFRTRFDVDRFRIEHAMEELAEFSGDIGR